MADSRHIHGIRVRGLDLGRRTQCCHYESKLDIVALKFACCEEYFSCFSCHEALADHPAQRWPESTFDTNAVLCGACGSELTIREYMTCEFACPECGAGFNPGCA